MIEIKNVYKTFGPLAVLKDICLTVEKGELLCMIGASGSGKSTLLQCINGLEPIQGGEIIVDGISVHDPKTNINTLRRKLGIVFQQYNAFPHLTAIENVALAPRVVAKRSRAEARQLAQKHLDHVGLGDKANVLPSKMSGGQQQRLAIARALAMEPSYMLFDEVTSALDPELVGEVLETMRLLRSEGMTMVVVTHDINFARETADRIAFLHQGAVCELGPAAQVIDNPAQEQTQRFLRRESRRPVDAGLRVIGGTSVAAK